MTVADLPDLIDVLRPLAWMDDALCIEYPDLPWFPAGYGQATPAKATPAKEVCARCSVSDECLAYAIENEIVDGIWGGLQPDEIKVELRKQRKTKPKAGPVATTCRICRLKETTSRTGRCETCANYHGRTGEERPRAVIERATAQAGAA